MNSQLIIEVDTLPKDKTLSFKLSSNEINWSTIHTQPYPRITFITHRHNKDRSNPLQSQTKKKLK